MWENTRAMTRVCNSPSRQCLSAVGGCGSFGMRLARCAGIVGRQCLSAVGGCGRKTRTRRLQWRKWTVVSAFRQLGDVGAATLPASPRRFPKVVSAFRQLGDVGDFGIQRDRQTTRESSVPFGSWGMWEENNKPNSPRHHGGRQCLSAVGGCGRERGRVRANNLLAVVSAFRQLGDVGAQRQSCMP